MRRYQYSEIGDDVEDARSNVVRGRVDGAVRRAQRFRWALEGLDEGPDEVEERVGPDERVYYVE